MKFRPSVLRAIAGAGFALLLSLYLDLWPVGQPRLPPTWVPEELAWRVLYVLVAWLYVLFVCAFVWREEPD